MADNQKQILRSEETVVAGQPDPTIVTQQTTTGAVPAGTPVVPAGTPVVPAATQTTVQSTAPVAPRGDAVVSHQVAQRVVDPAAEKAAGVDWISRVIWFIVGLMAALLAIRFVLLLSGANEDAGFAQLIYGLTGWMVAPFSGLFGRNLTYPGAAQTGVFEPEALIAIVVYALLGWALTKLAQLLLGTNRTDSVVYSDTERKTRL